MKKEVYIFKFPTQNQADFWFRQTIEKFGSTVINASKTKHLVEFEDSQFYFWSKNMVGGLIANATVYGPEELYIILDDIERTKLPTYEGK